MEECSSPYALDNPLSLLELISVYMPIYIYISPDILLIIFSFTFSSLEFELIQRHEHALSSMSVLSRLTYAYVSSSPAATPPIVAMALPLPASVIQRQIGWHGWLTVSARVTDT